MTDIVGATASPTQWGMFELALRGRSGGNPFLDVRFEATFSDGVREIKAHGFYDGEGIYRVRLLPEATGEWTYATRSNAVELDGVRGSFTVGAALPGAHGPVRVSNTHHFRHADGTRYVNIGTTAYVWNLQGDAAEEQTLRTLATAPFTKIRMCVFPKHYRYNQNEPELYPFELIRQGTSKWPARIDEAGWAFDFDRPVPEYFRHLEKRINDLAAIGVEADLILLHPYDRWGFSQMSAEQDDRYLRYVVSRLAAVPNVWWSMANEYDFMSNKTDSDWNRMIGVVADTDPHGHLLSIHNGFRPFDYSHPKVTHVSIQRPYTERSVTWRETFSKPVSVDECAYEGDIGEAWGNITGRELVHRFWMGTVNGGYVTHGETFYNDSEKLWWAKGGDLKGESVARIAFLRSIVEEGPDEGLDPMTFTGFYRVQKKGLDEITLPELLGPAPGEEDWPRAGTQYPTAGQVGAYYLSYTGFNQPRETQVSVPPSQRYSATLIDTWEMTSTVIAASVERGQVIRLPGKPFQALLLRRIE